MARKTDQTKPITMVDALNDPDMRRDIEEIEDLWMSLYQGERRDWRLEQFLAESVFSLQARGFSYDPRPAGWAAKNSRLAASKAR